MKDVQIAKAYKKLVVLAQQNRDMEASKLIKNMKGWILEDLKERIENLDPKVNTNLLNLTALDTIAFMLHTLSDDKAPDKVTAFDKAKEEFYERLTKCAEKVIEISKNPNAQPSQLTGVIGFLHIAVISLSTVFSVNIGLSAAFEPEMLKSLNFASTNQAFAVAALLAIVGGGAVYATPYLHAYFIEKDSKAVEAVVEQSKLGIESLVEACKKLVTIDKSEVVER